MASFGPICFRKSVPPQGNLIFFCDNLQAVQKASIYNESKYISIYLYIYAVAKNINGTATHQRGRELARAYQLLESCQGRAHVAIGQGARWVELRQTGEHGLVLGGPAVQKIK